MPIKAENKARYPRNWQQISADIRERAGNRCEFCGVPNYEIGGRSAAGVWHKAKPLGYNGFKLEWPKEGTHAWCAGHDIGPLRIVRIVLTVAHLDHQPENCDPGNLKALCQRCHNTYDQPHRRKNAIATNCAKKACGDLFAPHTKEKNDE